MSEDTPPFTEPIKSEILYPEQAQIYELEKKLAGIDGILDQQAKKIASLEKHCLQLSQQIFTIQSK